MDFAYNILSKQIQENLSQQQQRQQKIPRPVNAFMLYANENRKKMARAFPLDSNKEISKRLGKSWKELNQEQKTIYYALAKKVDEEHKKKYPDYVYNPKEARIRKAMRDAGRERAMGVAPATRGGRRSQPWVLPEPDDQFMLNQSTHGMRGSSMCGSGFPLGNVLGSGQFVQTMPSYNKHLHLVSHDTPYMQANPMAQLQHQTEMWHHYHQSANPSRPAPPTDQFMVSPHNSQAMPTYHQPSLSIESLENPIPGKLKSTVENFALNERPPSTPHHRESRDTSSISPNGSTELKINTHQQSQQPPQSEQSFDIEGKSETILDNTIDGYNLSSSGSLYQDEIVLQNPFDKVETTKGSKKTAFPAADGCIPLHEDVMSNIREDSFYHKQYIRNYIGSLKGEAYQILQQSSEDNSEGLRNHSIIAFTYATYPADHCKYHYVNPADINDLSYVYESCNMNIHNEEREASIANWNDVNSSGVLNLTVKKNKHLFFS